MSAFLPRMGEEDEIDKLMEWVKEETSSAMYGNFDSCFCSSFTHLSAPCRVIRFSWVSVPIEC